MLCWIRRLRHQTVTYLPPPAATATATATEPPPPRPPPPPEKPPPLPPPRRPPPPEKPPPHRRYFGMRTCSADWSFPDHWPFWRLSRLDPYRQRRSTVWAAVLPDPRDPLHPCLTGLVGQHRRDLCRPCHVLSYLSLYRQSTDGPGLRYPCRVYPSCRYQAYLLYQGFALCNLVCFRRQALIVHIAAVCSGPCKRLPYGAQGYVAIFPGRPAHRLPYSCNFLD